MLIKLKEEHFQECRKKFRNQTSNFGWFERLYRWKQKNEEVLIYFVVRIPLFGCLILKILSEYHSNCSSFGFINMMTILFLSLAHTYLYSSLDSLVVYWKVETSKVMGPSIQNHQTFQFCRLIANDMADRNRGMRISRHTRISRRATNLLTLCRKINSQ